MFDAFQRRRVAGADAKINLVVGGAGPPVLLLHGYPQVSDAWRPRWAAAGVAVPGGAIQWR